MVSDLEARVSKLEDENRILRHFVAKTLNVQHKLTYSMRDSIIGMVKYIPGVAQTTAIEMQKQIDIVNAYIWSVKKLLGFK